MQAITEESPACPATFVSNKRFQTTLFDLIMALQETADEDDLVVATLVHMLKTRRAVWTNPPDAYHLCGDPSAPPSIA
jgi:hypothetical protein